MLRGKKTASNFSAEVLRRFMWNFGTWHTTCSDVQECKNHVNEYLTSQSTNFVNAKQRIYIRKYGPKIYNSNQWREYFKWRSPSTIFMLTSQLECHISCVLCSCRVIIHSPVRSQVLYRKADGSRANLFSVRLKKILFTQSSNRYEFLKTMVPRRERDLVLYTSPGLVRIRSSVLTFNILVLINI
jgi:hypothetical protein